MKPQIWGILLSMSLFTGCSIPLKSDLPDMHTYRLSPHITQHKTAQSLKHIHLYLPKVEAAPGLDNTHIVLLKTPYEQDIIADSQWPDQLPHYLHSIITDALSASDLFASVSNRLISNHNNYKLLLKVSAFQAELPQKTTSSAKVVVKMEAFVIHSKTQKLLMHQRYKVEGRNIEVRVSSLVEALNNALNKTLDLLVKDLGSKL